MKKLVICLFALMTIVLTYCTGGKKAAATKVVPVTYMTDISPLMTTHCTPCHFPPKGNKKPYDNYIAAKEDIDEIIGRISKNPTDRGFMPMKHPKLSDSTINVFVKWKKGGLLETK